MNYTTINYTTKAIFNRSLSCGLVAFLLALVLDPWDISLISGILIFVTVFGVQIILRVAKEDAEANSTDD